MEPMTLGSPVGSSASPVSPGFTSPYLPEFLMGESTPGVSWNVIWFFGEHSYIFFKMWSNFVYVT